MKNAEILSELQNVTDCLRAFEGYNEHSVLQGRAHLKIAITCVEQLTDKLAQENRRCKNGRKDNSV